MTTDPSRAPTARFSNRARDYARARPSYPQPAIDALLDGAPSPRSFTITDIGAGTGIASRLLADHPAVDRVLAVEPNADMRAAADPHPRVQWIDATGEATTIDDASIDLVTCAQAFHWLEPEAALAEFARIINPHSPLRRAALIWNDHAAAPVMTAYKQTILAHATDPPKSPWNLNEAQALSSSPLFTNHQTLAFPNQQTLTLERLLLRALSASYVPNEGPARTALETDLRALFSSHAIDNRITLAYQTIIHTAEVAP